MYRILIFLIAVACFTCSDEKHQAKSNRRAFYFWQTSLGAFNWRDSLYQSFHVEKVYARMFDVNWDASAATPMPVSPLRSYYSAWTDSAQLVPVVFITNETFKNLDKNQSAELAHHVHKKIMNMLTTLVVSHSDYALYNNDYWQQDPYQVKSKDLKEHQRHDSLYNVQMTKVKEVQFDCDWTASTKEKYFAFLEESVKLFEHKLVSSTVRLYQYKYPDKAGVPPVKRGMLMCYNAGDIKDSDTKNSIFDKDEIESYLDGDAYPVPLDYALPTFEWGVLFQEGKFKSILSTSELEDYAANLEVKDNVAIVKQDFTYGDNYNSLFLRQGDEIRLEKPDMKEVEEIAEWLSDHKNNSEAVLSLYHLNEYDLKKHSKEVESIFNSF